VDLTNYWRYAYIVAIFAATLSQVRASVVWAAGFQIFELGVKGQGVAHAGMATRADGPETLYFNPAGMVYLPGSQVSFGLTKHFVEADFTGRGEYSPATGPFSGIGFENSTRGSDGGDPLSLPAAGIYATHSLSEDLRLGLGINTPFGLRSDYHKGWAGRYLALKSSLKTININPSIALRVNEKLALAVGFNAVYADAKLTQAIDLGLLLVPLGETPGALANDGVTKVSGRDWGFGGNLGLIFEPLHGTRVGVAYRSQQKLDIDGRIRFDSGRFSPALFGQALKSGRATAPVKLPQWASISFYQAVTPEWAAMFDATWTDWSVIEELRIRFPGNPPRPDTVLPTNWKDSWRFALGSVYTPSAVWTLRGGIAYEKTPVPNPQNYNPRIPAGDGVSLAFGASYTWNRNWTVDAAYTHIFIDALRINRTEGAHRLVGSYQGSVDIIGMQLNYTFH
jgi:long-chain fatty acid transport protein